MFSSFFVLLYNIVMKKKAFTLFELLIVIAIIAILALVVFVLINPLERIQKSRNAQRQADVRNIVDAVRLHQVDSDGQSIGINSTLQMLGTATTGCDVMCGGGGDTSNVSDSSQSNFNLGSYSNTEYSSGSVQLSAPGLTAGSGEYISEVKNAGLPVNWLYMQWEAQVSSGTTDIIYHSSSESNNYYSNNTYSVRNWFNSSESFDSVTVNAVLDCDDTCSGNVRIRIGNTFSWTDYDFVDASTVRTNGTTSDYSFYSNTYNLDSATLGDYWFVQVLKYEGSGTIRFMMDEQGPTGPDAEYRTSGNGDGSQSGWNNDNGDYFISVRLNAGNSDVNFQVRSGDSGSLSGSFLGPDGTTSTYFTNDGGVNLNISDDQYFQYKAYFSTDSATTNPKLNSVEVGYSENSSSSIMTEPVCLDLTSILNHYLPLIPFDPKYGNIEITQYAIEELSTGALKIINCTPELEQEIFYVK